MFRLTQKFNSGTVQKLVHTANRNALGYQTPLTQSLLTKAMTSQSRSYSSHAVPTSVPLDRGKTVEEIQAGLKNAPSRKAYEEKAKRLADKVPTMTAQALSAMDIGADPVEEANTMVQMRQGLKEDTRAQAQSPIMNKLIKLRQQEKYGGGGGGKPDSAEIGDPTAHGLVLKAMTGGKGKKPMSPESAAVHVIGSGATPTKDFSGEFAKLASKHLSDDELRELHRSVHGTGGQSKS